MKRALLIVFILVVLVLTYLFLPQFFVRMKYPLEYEQDIVAKSSQADISPALLASLVYNESRYNSQAVSTQNAYGLAQVQIPTASHVLGREVSSEELLKPKLNLKIGARYLDELIDRYENDKLKALVAYNLGPTKMDQKLKEGAELNDLEDSYIFARKVVEIEKIYSNIYAQSLEIENPANLTTFNLWSSLLY